jgi:hypothetical protein
MAIKFHPTFHFPLDRNSTLLPAVFSNEIAVGGFFTVMNTV